MPIIVRAVFKGAVAATAGTVPWALLVAANLKIFPGVPWSVPVMALYLSVLWRHAPRTNLRANRLSEEVWAAALLAGGLGLWALMLFLAALNRVVRLPAQQAGELSHVPVLTVVALVAMGSIVAGLVEEASFRGYMQKPIEERHGPVIAILVTGSLFGFAHFSHPEVTLMLMPYYLAVAAIYGTLAYLTNSIWPGVVLHAGGNMFVALDFFARGQSEWQASATPAPLIWESGPDASFWLSAVGALIVGAAAVAAYSALAAVARNTPIRAGVAGEAFP
jgi:membrane protease YdiL (CAAX protease family)